MKRSKNKYDVYIWMKQVADSVQTLSQLINYRKLIKFYSERYDISWSDDEIDLLGLRERAYRAYLLENDRETYCNRV